MIISAKIIKRPRKVRKCPDCYQLIEGEQLRLYGYAEPGDRPYAVYLHPACGMGSKEVRRKLEPPNTVLHTDGGYAPANGAFDLPHAIDCVRQRYGLPPAAGKN